MKLIDLYYQIKPIIPRRVQIYLRRLIAARKHKAKKAIWPIDPDASKRPQGWPGWPNQKKFSLILQHDVDTIRGLKNCLKLMDIERKLGFRSAFNFVPEDYPTPYALRRNLVDSGFEVGVHGLKHDGKLFKNREVFDQNALRINRYLKEWGAVGFTSPSMLRNLSWMGELDIEHGCSTFDTDPFEPQSEGMATIFPFAANNSSRTRSYIELPYTLPQDHCLFVILRKENNQIWKEKLDWIVENGGMAALNSHPDYMNFDSRPCSLEEYPASLYLDFLEYIKSRYADQYWHVLPREVARFWVQSMPPDESPQRTGIEPIKVSALNHSVQQSQAAIGPKVKIWIDLDNTPHVPFFIPIIRELERRGHRVVLTARDAFQVCELADEKGLRYTKIGRHYGKNSIMKIIGLFWRSMELSQFYLRQKPGLALSHGSRSQNLLCNFLRIPSILIGDYEHARNIPMGRAKWLIVPDVVPADALSLKPDRIRYYRGIKEDVYVPEFKPDPSFLDDLGLRQAETIVAVRPPANEAHYYNPESDVLFVEFMARVSQTPKIRTILLPRNRGQEQYFRASHPEWFADAKTVVPSRALDGLNILWFSDLVVSGGGTMNREAAALGLPVHSIFRGTTGAVDHMLEEQGRLTIIRSVEEVWSKIQFNRRNKSQVPDYHPRAALLDIIKHIEDILLLERVRPYELANADKPAHNV